jgi:hypothetical protein
MDINTMTNAEVTTAFAVYAAKHFTRPRLIAQRNQLFARTWLVRNMSRLYDSIGTVSAHQTRSARVGDYTDGDSEMETDDDSDDDFVVDDNEVDEASDSSDEEEEAEFTDSDDE